MTISPSRLWALLDDLGTPFHRGVLDDWTWRRLRRSHPEVADVAAPERKRLSAMTRFEREIREAGILVLAGLDEAGRGPLAGPLVAGAVVFAEPPWIVGLQDSKQLTAEERGRVRAAILSTALDWAVAEVSVEEMAQMNMHAANLLALERARAQLKVVPDMLLIDGRFPVRSTERQQAVVKGDSKSYSVAAASILAKTHRDALMERLHDSWPQYGFCTHKGYSTPEHLAALKQHGPCPAHRVSFRRVRELLDDRQGQLFEFEMAEG